MIVKNLGLKIVFVMALGFLLGWTMRPVPVVAPLASVNENIGAVVHLMFDYGDGTLETERNIGYSDGATVFSITNDVASKKNLTFKFDPPGDWGVFVRQIGARQNGEQNRYWQYWVNHEQVQVSADRAALQPNDVVEWKFVKTQ